MIKLIRGSFILFMYMTVFCSCKTTDDKDTLVPLNEFQKKHIINTRVEFCTQSPESSRSFLNFIFVLDKSSSNQSSPGTDPVGDRRYLPILDFLNNSIPTDTEVRFMLVNFSTDAKIIKVNDEGFLDEDTFRELVNKELQKTKAMPSSDTGFTNYSAALQNVQEAIVADLQYKKDTLNKLRTTQYQVLYFSDGVPVGSDGQPQDHKNIVSKVGDIHGIQFEEDYKRWVENIFISTIYYYGLTEDTLAKDLMNQMAQKAEGQSLAFAQGDALVLEKLIPPKRNVAHTLEAIYVNNRSVTWDGDVLKYDGDLDGIPDDTEIKLGSDPKSSDSDENGVSDGVEYFSTGRPCSDDQCSSSGAMPYNSCVGFVKSTWLPGDLDKFTDIDGDGLNDCEETAVIESKRDDFDSNQDWYTDYLAFNSQGAISIVGNPKNNGAHLDPDSDGVTNAEEMKLGSPYKHNNNLIEDLKLANYFLELSSRNELQNCYILKVDNIVGIGSSSHVEVNISEKSIVDDRRFLRRARKEVKANGTVFFTNEDF